VRDVCAAIVHARVRRLVFGAWIRGRAAGSIVDVFKLPG